MGIMSTPFVYLGILVGGNPRRLSFCDILKLRKKLSSWSRKTLYIGGSMCLIKSVFSSLPLYYLSLFRMSSRVLQKCKRIKKDFLWGGAEGDNKNPWVRCDKVFRAKEDGGLGVRNLDSFNKALLGNWRGRLIIESKNMWFITLKAKCSDGAYI